MNSHPCSDHHGEGPSIFDLPTVPLSLRQEWLRLETRRHFLGRMGKTLGWAALASLMGPQLRASTSTAGSQLPSRVPHFAPRAKRCIYLFMSGAPPQMDLWDYKPGLHALRGQDLPDSVRQNQVLTGMTAGQSRFAIKPPSWGFKQQGKSGRWVSDLLPWTGKLVDDIAVVHSLYTDAINHEPAILLMNTGNMNPGRPSLGAWLSYGLGSANENLPSFVVLNSKLIEKANNQPVSPRLWSSGFLPNQHSGVAFRNQGDPILYLNDPAGLSRESRRELIDAVNALNRVTYEELGDPETNARINQYEMAFRLQTSVPELADLSNEPTSTWELYGEEAKEPGTFAYNCLMARRLAERDVRFVQIYQRGWDVHQGVTTFLPQLCGATDRACYALITDLKQRGLLDDTLVIWGGEFGRTVYSQEAGDEEHYGRDHHPRCFTIWLAGAGVKRGSSFGITDEFSYNIVKDPVHVRDLNASILFAMGIDHERLTYKYQGLDQKLTSVVPAHVVRELFS